MGNCENFIRSCAEDCKCRGELNTANAAELLLEKFGERLDSGGVLSYEGLTDKPKNVKTVNGAAPDENGNVTIETAAVEDVLAALPTWTGGEY